MIYGRCSTAAGKSGVPPQGAAATRMARQSLAAWP
jgi:hypothetical protein